MIDFEVPAGTRVVLAKDYPDGNESLTTGMCGTVCADWSPEMIEMAWIPVEYDEEFDGGHNCNDRCEHGHGWNTPPKYLELEQEAEIREEDIPDDEELLCLLFQ